MDEAGVVAKFGVLPESIPDWLALVGDSADGFPGLPEWGAKASARVLARYKHLEEIPLDPEQWDVPVQNRRNLARTLVEQLENALLFRTLARLRTDPPFLTDVDELRWKGPRPGFDKVAETLGGRLAERVDAVAARYPRSQ